MMRIYATEGEFRQAIIDELTEQDLPEGTDMSKIVVHGDDFDPLLLYALACPEYYEDYM